MSASKASKQSVDYSEGMTERHCGPWSERDKNYCSHFRIGFQGKPYKQGSCTKVAGTIGARMWCRFYERTKS